MKERAASLPAILPPFEEAAAEIDRAAAAAKCHPCGCFQDAVEAVEQSVPEAQRPPALAAALGRGRAVLAERRYDCLGCEVCFPALALNALAEAGAPVEIDRCPGAAPQEREGWPPLPGDYVVVRYRAPVAVCVLHSAELTEPIVRGGEGVSIVGTVETENLGVERIIKNVLADPHIRFLVLCGTDSRRAVGHLPGQSLAALARSGLDDRGRIVGAKGRRPVLKNVARDAVEHFRRTVEVVDLVGETEPSAILGEIRRCAERDPGPAEVFRGIETVRPVFGRLPGRMVPDPAGYFVVYVDRPRGVILLEHYRTDGVLGGMIEGRTAAEVYTPVVEGGLVTRLDHAAYLGRELARAEAALVRGEPFRQEGAPEAAIEANRSSCDCHVSCEGAGG